MNELVKWLRDNVGDNVRIITPQFERVSKRDFEWIPQTPEQFKSIVDKAPLKILLGLGFRRWDTMNNLVKENAAKPIHQEVSIPIIKAPGKNFTVDMGRQDAPVVLLEVDEDVLLFPSEWYNIIPDGFMVTGLYGEQYPFKKGDSDDDIRFGCLAYGIRRQVVEVSHV